MIITITTYLGIVGALLIMTSGLPQIHKLLKTKSSDDISLATYRLVFYGVLLLFTHSVATKSFVFILNNGITLIMFSILIFLVKRYRRINGKTKT